jgi:hypothetical protein
MFFQQFADFFLVYLEEIFLLFLLGLQKFPLVVFGLLFDVGNFLLEFGFAFMAVGLLLVAHVHLDLSDDPLGFCLCFLEFLLVGADHCIVLLHPALGLQLTLVFGEGYLLHEFLDFPLVSHFER